MRSLIATVVIAASWFGALEAVAINTGSRAAAAYFAGGGFAALLWTHLIVVPFGKWAGWNDKPAGDA